jgi:hypothetical protein
MVAFPLNARWKENLASITGPDGQPMKAADLPPANTKRWVVRRKAMVVLGVRGGLLSLDEACEYYNLSEEEYQSWSELIDRHGIRGLRVTRLKEYRDTSPKSAG